LGNFTGGAIGADDRAGANLFCIPAVAAPQAQRQSSAHRLETQEPTAQMKLDSGLLSMRGEVADQGRPFQNQVGPFQGNGGNPPIGKELKPPDLVNHRAFAQRPQQLADAIRHDQGTGARTQFLGLLVDPYRLASSGQQVCREKSGGRPPHDRHVRSDILLTKCHFDAFATDPNSACYILQNVSLNVVQ
jgi:hypothetical protein